MDSGADIEAQAQIDSEEVQQDNSVVNERLESRLVKEFCWKIVCDWLVIFRLPEDDVSECEKYIERVKPIGIAPCFVISPKDCYVVSSQTAVFETRIFATPKPIVRWYKNGHLINTAQFAKMKVSEPTNAVNCFLMQTVKFLNRFQKQHFIPETYRLEIPQLLATDAGQYTCTARNCYGTITATATLRIMDLETDEHPKFLKRLKRTDIVSDANSHVTVVVSGEPKPKVEWLKNSLPLKESKRIEVEFIQNNRHVSVDSI